MLHGWGVLGDVVLAAMLTLGIAFGVAGQTPTGAPKVDGQIEITRGQSLVVTLEANPTTGYHWTVAEMDPNILRQEGDAILQLSDAGKGNLLGAGGTEALHFEATGAGKTNLKLIYHRPWETNVPPLKTYVVQVTVR